MTTFLESEKPKQAAFKATAPYFSDAARARGIYRNKPYPFCLPREYAEENLVPGIRQAVTVYFASREIKWHDGQDRRPSNHLCDSQVCCVNFLFPFADKPRALAALLRPVFPPIEEMLPIEDSQFVAHEWIGMDNYLHEKMPRHGKRTRGANFTSADAAIMFKRNDGLKQIVLIEWKYTESYGGTFLRFAKSGTDRAQIYQHLYDREGCPINKQLLPSYYAFFFEPFYQFMRQQFLAHEMERAHELGADIVSVLHITPAHNSNFQKITSPELRSLGNSATDVWTKLISTPDRFISISTEQLFGHFAIDQYPDLQSWYDYITARYSWLLSHSTN